MNAALLSAAPGEVKIPRRACYLRQPEDAVLELGSKPDDPRLFSMVALTGKPIPHWWFGTLGIDLKGIRMKQRLPVLKDHDTEQRLGYTTELRVDPVKGLVAEGKLLAKSSAVQAVLADAADGFPWQASTYLQAHRVQRIGPGEEAELNGHTVKGPAVIFRESTLREVTVTALGADDDTSTTALSDGNGADEELVVLLSDLESTMTKQQTEANPAPVAASAPAAAASPAPNDAQLAAEAARKECERATAILSAAADSQRELAATLIKDGVPLTDALLRLNHDLRVKLAEKHTQAATSAVSLAAGNSANVAPTDPETARLAAMPEGEDKWKAQFAASAELRAEFLNDVGVYLAFKKHESRSRPASRKEAEAL